jgi:hypothetical protein
MSVKGKKLGDHKVVTVSDLSQSGRRSEIGRHYTYAAAGRAYPRIWEIYGRLHKHRVWQEEVIDGVASGGPMTDLSDLRGKELMAHYDRNLAAMGVPEVK